MSHVLRVRSEVQHSQSQILQEKCGVVGLINPTQVSTTNLFQAMNELQGRGTDCAGVVGRSAVGKIVIQKTEGRISDLFTSTTHELLEGCQTVIGHNRYATSQELSLENTQPFVVSDGTYRLALAHNGNLLDSCVAELKAMVTTHTIEGTSDSAFMTSFLMQERTKFSSWSETFLHTLPQFKGAFSLVMMTEDGNLYAARDPWGIRPLALGVKGQTTIVTSETVSFDAMKAEYLRELEPGELFSVTPEGTTQSFIYGLHPNQEMRCALETFYFSRPKSFDGQNTLANQRLALGRGVAKRFLKKGITGADCVVPVLASGLLVAEGVAAQTGLPLVEAIPLNPHATRSFIQNTQEKRRQAIYEKHIVGEKYLKGQSILLCDDSIVRGNSLKVLIERVHALGSGAPKAIHVLVGSPPIVDICDLGVAISSTAELLAGTWQDLSLAEIEERAAAFFKVDSVTFSTPEIIEQALQKPNIHLCNHCFGGMHPVNETVKPLYRANLVEQLSKQRVLFLASGTGSNVAALLVAMTNGTILAEPIGVLTNHPNAGVLQHAARYQLATQIIDSAHQLKTPALRQAYFKKVLDAVLHQPGGQPDIIVLAGWNLILPDDFLIALEKANIAVINLHPALLTGKGSDSIMSSQGLIPEIRGADGIDQASRGVGSHFCKEKRK